MVAVENPVLNGAQLVKALAESGAGARTMEPARECLRLYHTKYGKVAPANEVLAALGDCGEPGTPYQRFRAVSAASLDKARALAETGAWVPPKHREEVPIEQLLLDGAEKLPEAPKPKAPAAPEAPGDRAEVTSLPATALNKVTPNKKPAAAE